MVFHNFSQCWGIWPIQSIHFQIPVALWNNKPLFLNTSLGCIAIGLYFRCLPVTPFSLHPFQHTKAPQDNKNVPPRFVTSGLVCLSLVS